MGQYGGGVIDESWCLAVSVKQKEIENWALNERRNVRRERRELWGCWTLNQGKLAMYTLDQGHCLLSHHFPMTHTNTYKHWKREGARWRGGPIREKGHPTVQWGPSLQYHATHLINFSSFFLTSFPYSFIPYLLATSHYRTPWEYASPFCPFLWD